MLPFWDARIYGWHGLMSLVTNLVHRRLSFEQCSAGLKYLFPDTCSMDGATVEIRKESVLREITVTSLEWSVPTVQLKYKLARSQPLIYRSKIFSLVFSALMIASGIDILSVSVDFNLCRRHIVLQMYDCVQNDE